MDKLRFACVRFESAGEVRRGDGWPSLGYPYESALWDHEGYRDEGP